MDSHLKQKVKSNWILINIIHHIMDADGPTLGEWEIPNYIFIV
tara:strand:+ start:11458 stop:11586 length:129 start_codon:yes stop_codon:yes gene_type:complete